MTNNEKLKDLVDEYGLSREEIAELTMSSIHGVKNWLSSPDSVRYRNMPDSRMKLLVDALADREIED